MRADERLGEFMDAFVSRSGSASKERKATEAISVCTITDPSEVDVHTVMPAVAATTVHVIDSSDGDPEHTVCSESDGTCSDESDCKTQNLSIM